MSIFFQREFKFDEGPVSRIVGLTVNRGYDLDGITEIGSVDGIATLNFMFIPVPNSAVLGQDFRRPLTETSQQIVFVAGQRTASINVEIIEDSDAEMDEYFQVWV